MTKFHSNPKITKAGIVLSFLKWLEGEGVALSLDYRPWPSVAIDQETGMVKTEYLVDGPTRPKPIGINSQLTSYSGQIMFRSGIHHQDLFDPAIDHKDWDLVDLAFILEHFEIKLTGSDHWVYYWNQKDDTDQNEMKDHYGPMFKYICDPSYQAPLYNELYRDDGKPASPIAVEFWEKMQWVIYFYQKDLWLKYYGSSDLENNAKGYQVYKANLQSEVSEEAQTLISLNGIEESKFTNDVSLLVGEFLSGNFNTAITEKNKYEKIGTFDTTEEKLGVIDLYTVVSTIAGAMDATQSNQLDVQSGANNVVNPLSPGSGNTQQRLRNLKLKNNFFTMTHYVPESNNTIFRKKQRRAAKAFATDALSSIRVQHRQDLVNAGLAVQSPSLPTAPAKKFDYGLAPEGLDKNLSSMQTLEKLFANEINALPTRAKGTGKNISEMAKKALKEVSWDQTTYATKMKHAHNRFVKKTADDKKISIAEVYNPLKGASFLSSPRTDIEITDLTIKEIENLTLNKESEILKV